MEEFPIQVIVWPVVMVLVLVGTMVWRKRAMASMGQQFANFRVGTLAPQLGLQLVEGDPEFNPMMLYADTQRQGMMKNGEMIERRVRMAGRPLGHPVEFIYHSRVRCEIGFSGTTLHKLFECRITVLTRATYPDFEVISRTNAFGHIPQKLPLPPQSFGNAMLDQQFAVASSDARVGPVLGGVIGGFAALATAGVHLVAENGGISFVMTETNITSAIYHAATIIQGLESVARAVGSAPSGT